MMKILYERAGIDIVTVRTYANFFIGMEWMYRQKPYIHFFIVGS